jgi:hypothetical protein
LRFATFGILTSTGELSGSPFGIQLRLGGSLVAAVVVAGGGSLYELYVRPDSFNTRVVFYESTPATSVDIAGSLTLFVGSGRQNVAIERDGTALIQNLQRRARLHYVLRSSTYEVAPGEKDTISPGPEGLVYIKVQKKKPFESYDTSKLTFTFESALADKTVQGGYSIAIRLTVWSESEQPVPLRSAAILKLTKAGLPYRSYSAEVSDGSSDEIILVKPRRPQTITVGADFPSDYENLVNEGFQMEITLSYADPNKANGGDYDVTPIAFNSRNFVLDK